MHLKSLVLSPWLCFLESEDSNVLLRTRTFTTLSPNFSLLNFPLGIFPQLHVVWSCPPCYHLSHIHLAFSLPLTFPALDPSNSCPNGSQSPNLVFSLLCKEPSVSLRMTFKVLNSVKTFLPSFSTFLLRHLASSGVRTFSDPSPSLCAPHCLGHCFSPLHLHNSFPPGPDSGWENAPGLNSQATSEHFSDTWNWWGDPPGSSTYTSQRSQELELLILVAISSTVCRICYQYFSETCLNFIYMVLYKITFLFIQSINMPFMVFSFILFSCFSTLSCLFLEKLTFDVSQLIERLRRRHDKHKKILFPGGVHEIYSTPNKTQEFNKINPQHMRSCHQTC